MEPEGSLPHSQEPAIVPVLSQINPVHAHLSYFLNIYFDIILYIRLDLTSGLFPSSFPTKILYAFFLHPPPSTPATCLTYLTLLYLITLILFG
jgi:hypothetical protein